MCCLFNSCVLKASDISMDTRPICWSISVASQPTYMSPDHSISKPSMLGRHSGDTLPTLRRYSTDTWSVLSGSKFRLMEEFATPKTGNRRLAGLVDGSARPFYSRFDR